ncbi:MAG: SfnB family sulfur acquisition oxidoreductase [Sphingomonas sp.]
MSGVARVTARRAPTVIASDAEAIAVARDLRDWLAVTAAARDRDRPVPWEALEALSASGLLGITVPRAHGGADVSFETVAEVFRLLSAGDPAIGQLPQNHFVFVDAIRQDGTPRQQAFFFAEFLAGRRLGNAQAERGSASALDLRTRLAAKDGAFRLDGTKYYCTGALTADWIPVAAIDEDGRGVLAYVPRTAPGVEVLEDWNAIGQRVTFSGTARFVDVHVPADHVIAHWRLFERPSLFHAYATLIHAAIDVGIARNAWEDMVRLIRARARPRLGAQVSAAQEDPHLLARLGELRVGLRALEALLADAAHSHDDARREGVDSMNSARAAVAASAAKAYAEDVALAISSDLFALAGSASVDRALSLDRHWRNARTHTVHDANQWRYHQIGDWFVNDVSPGKPVRKATAG